MKITVWGSRGSLPSPGPGTKEFGGNTSCIEVQHEEAYIILDAGSGIRRLNDHIPTEVNRIDILLTHLHLDHIMGLGFFAPFYNPKMTVNIWGPTSTKFNLRKRLTRYLSPPLFPIRLQDLPCQLEVREVNHSTFNIGTLTIHSSYVCHPGPTLGYRLESLSSVLTYLPDHEPVLSSANFPNDPQWTSGYDLAKEADLLFHDAQYTPEEYQPRVGWGHSTMQHALQFAQLSKVKRLMLFHHDPSHKDHFLKTQLSDNLQGQSYPFQVAIAGEGDQFLLP